MKLDKSGQIAAFFVGGFIGGIIAYLIKGGSVRDPFIEAIGVLLGAIIIGPILMKFWDKNV